MWFEESVFYQIYPLGFVGAPFENAPAEYNEQGVKSFCARSTVAGEPSSTPSPADADKCNTVTNIEISASAPIRKVIGWIPHLEKLGVNAVYFSPVFESDTHGYNTRDYGLIDRRLGTNEDFKEVVEKLHEAGIRVVLDGVFNHVGRGFWAFHDVQEKKWDSPYKDWFHISFDGNSNYNDGFWYEGWEGCFDLVKLNLRNDAVVNHIFDKIRYWVDYFGIDGLRLDVAYCLDREFLKRLRGFTETLKPEFLLLGELLHGDYKMWVNGEMCHSCTNYACYKGLFSSFNCMNMFEVIHTLIQQFGPENWSWFRGLHLMSFVDNHDVTRIASNLNNPAHLPLIYTLAFGMPGFPCVYYGSEWGAKARKEEGDPALRPCFDKPEWTELTEHIATLAEIKKNSPALNYGSFRSVVLTNQQCIFERRWEGDSAEGCREGKNYERVLVAINAADYEYTAHFDAGCGQSIDLLTGKVHDFGGGSVLPPYSCAIWKMEH
ncbi:MAG: cyclomaltodextrinase [Clostridiales bacterium]|nr:cyclomaltodextrinase [Clostridiales bacterium]